VVDKFDRIPRQPTKNIVSKYDHIATIILFVEFADRANQKETNSVVV
jgi:hypothetical protein